MAASMVGAQKVTDKFKAQSRIAPGEINVRTEFLKQMTRQII